MVDPETASAALERLPPYPGIARLRRILTQHTRTDSDLERRFLRLVKQAGLPAPETQARVNGHRVDFYWPDLRLVVETDDKPAVMATLRAVAERLRNTPPRGGL